MVLWRAGLRISEALALAETDLDVNRGAVVVRSGKGGKRREVGMDRWAWQQLGPWLDLRGTMPVGPFVLCASRPNASSTVLGGDTPRAATRRCGARRGQAAVAPHQLRHAHAVEISREGVPLVVIQRQLGHADLAVTSVYLRGIDNTEIIHTIHERPRSSDLGVGGAAR